MFASRPSRSLLASCTTAAALLLLAAGASAQCDVFRTGVPDLDQRRDPLPGNGNTYCVPTSILNWFAFIANHGYPAVLQGPRDWQSQANVDFITQQLLILDDPILMDTNTEFGTTHSGAQRGARTWLDNFAPGKFVVESRGASATFEPSPLECYLLLSYGSLPMTCFGRYNFTPAGVPTGAPSPRLVRDGGHCTTLTRVYDACTSTPEFWYRDPAGFDGDLVSQAQFVTQHTDLAENTLLIAATLEDAPVVRNRWFRTPVGSTRQIFDGLIVIHPTQGLTVDATQGQVSVMNSYNFDTLTAPPVQTFPLPTGAGTVESVLYQPARPYGLVVAGQSGNDVLYRLDLTSGQFVNLRPLGDAGPCIIDRQGELHIYASNSFQRINTGVYPPVVMQSLTAVPRPVAMAHDDSTGRTLMIVNGRLGTVTPAATPEDPSGYMEEFFPPGLSLASSPSLAVNPVDGSILIAGDDPGADGITVLARTSAGALFVRERITHSSIVNPRSIQATSRGTIIFTSRGIVRELIRTGTGTTGAWISASDCPFVGQTVGPAFSLRASRFIHGEWTNTVSDFTTLPPDGGPGVPDCRVDFDNNGIVSPDDLDEFITTYFSEPPENAAADFNDDGIVSPDDLDEFITEYFAGCAS